MEDRHKTKDELINDLAVTRKRVEELETLLNQRRQAEEALEKANTQLKLRLEERTEELSQVNEQLRSEMIDCGYSEQSSRERVEAALRESQKPLQRLFESNLIGVSFWNVEGFITQANDAYLRLAGYSREEFNLLGKISWRLLTPPEYKHLDDRAIEETLATGVSNVYEKEYIHRDGKRVPIVLGVALLNESVHDGVAFVLDITERKQAEAALRISEARFRRLFESNVVGIFFPERSGKITEANDAFLQMVGYTREDLLSGKVRWDTMTPPEYAYLDRRAIEEHRLTGFNTPYEKVYIRPDGSYVPALIAGVTLEKDPDKGIAVAIDLTERKQAEEARDKALAETEAARAQLQRVFMQAPALIQVSRGPLHVIETANPLYMQVVGNRDLIGKTIREALPQFEGQGFFELLDEVYASGKPFVGNEVRALFDRNNDGVLEESFWNFVYQPLVDADGKVNGIMTHAVEVTEQVRARQEVEKKAAELASLTQALELTNQELDQFAYIASHDLKAPLRAIANLAEWIEEDLADQITEESQEHLNLLRGRVNRMQALIDGILQYSRAGRFHDTQTVNVADLLSEAIELLAPPPQVNVVVRPGMPTLKTEPVPLQQIFMNLINNALKYAQKPDVCVLVEVRPAGNYYEFSVADNGAGIAPEYHEKIWGIFQRLESRDKIEGTGIGLSVVKKIVESRGGRVWLESEVGAGTTFYFTWPKHA
jgi:PAS domain S-box-containing protein